MVSRGKVTLALVLHFEKMKNEASLITLTQLLLHTAIKAVRYF